MADEEVKEDLPPCPEITFKWTGLAIREYLMQMGEGYPYHFYICYKRIKPKTSYQSVRRYFSFLKKLGLIEPTRTEPASRHGWLPRTYYRIVPGKEDAEEWYAPQATLYPETRLGRKRYSRLKGEE